MQGELLPRTIGAGHVQVTQQRPHLGMGLYPSDPGVIRRNGPSDRPSGYGRSDKVEGGTVTVRVGLTGRATLIAEDHASAEEHVVIAIGATIDCDYRAQTRTRAYEKQG